MVTVTVCTPHTSAVLKLVPSYTQDQSANTVVKAHTTNETAVQTISFDSEAQEYPKHCIGNEE
jgi:hypothetical protein